MSNDSDNLKPIANIGDIVRVEGYGLRTFEVVAYSYERYIDAENDVDDIWYDVACTQTTDLILAGQEDITVLIRKGASPIGQLTPTIEEEPPEDDSPTIDDLLEELSDTLALIERFGEHEDDERRDRKYSLRACEIKAKLKELTADERT